MKVTITGNPKEIAALVDELQERRERKLRGPDYKGALTLEKVTSARIAAYGTTADKLGDPAEATHKLAGHAVTTEMLADDPRPISDAEQRSLESRFPEYRDPGKYFEVRRTP